MCENLIFKFSLLQEKLNDHFFKLCSLSEFHLLLIVLAIRLSPKESRETIAEAWHSRCVASSNCQCQLFRFSESLGLRNPVQGYLINVHMTALASNDTKEGDTTTHMTSVSCNWLSDCNSQIQLVGNRGSTPIYEIAERIPQ